MGSYTTGVSDLRTMLADTPVNRFAHRKKVLGTINGTNKVFKTFEGRRVTDFTSAVAPLGVYYNGSLQTVDADDLVSGEFQLHTAPASGAGSSELVVTGTYYYQWFLDTDLQAFLTDAANWLAVGNGDYTQLTGGLISAALQFAAGNAMRFLALHWAERASKVFLLEDAPKKESLGLADTYLKLADSYSKQSEKLRNSFYTKSGQALSANFASNWGRVSNVTPRR